MPREPASVDLLAPEKLATLKRAAEEVAWLVGRGYPLPAVMTFVVAQHGLSSAERMAVERGVCSDAQYRYRVLREIEPDEVARRPLQIDAASLVRTVRALVAGSGVVKTLDGTIHDLAEGDLSPNAGDEPAFRAIIAALRSLRPSKTRWVIAEASPAASTLRAAIEAHRAELPGTTEIKVVPSLEAALGGAARIVSSDPSLLDRCGSWYNLAGWIAERTQAARIIALL